MSFWLKYYQFVDLVSRLHSPLIHTLITTWLQDMSCDVLDEPSPLGLRLRKSPSLLDLIQMKLSQAKSAKEQFNVHNSTSDTPKKKDVKSGVPTAGERMKASNFHANVLKIGSWEVINFLFSKNNPLCCDTICYWISACWSNYFVAFLNNPV
jgi:hypothetical protein